MMVIQENKPKEIQQIMQGFGFKSEGVRLCKILVSKMMRWYYSDEHSTSYYMYLNLSNFQNNNMLKFTQSVAPA